MVAPQGDTKRNKILVCPRKSWARHLEMLNISQHNKFSSTGWRKYV